jgi:hypothetical protein
MSKSYWAKLAREGMMSRGMLLIWQLMHWTHAVNGKRYMRSETRRKFLQTGKQ